MLNKGLQTKNTLSSLVKYGKKLPLSHSAMHIKSKLKFNDTNVIVNYHSFIDEYMDFIKPILIKYTLTDNEYEKYIYQPKLFCLDNYGEAELWSILLKVNNMTSILEFDRKDLILFTDEIFDILSEILILESDDIRDNKLKVGE